MRKYHSGLLATLLLLLGLLQARPLRGQDSTSAPTPATTIVDRRFEVGESTSVRVALERGVVYRIWLSRPARFRGIPSERRIFPYIVDVTRSSLIGNGVEFEVYPAYTGPVTLLIGPATPASVTDIVIWRDVQGTARGDPNVGGADDNWEFGFELAAGAHTAMGKGSTGGSYEGCVALRRGGGRVSILSGCILGLATYLRPGSGRISTLFVEPRWRLAGAPLTLLHRGHQITFDVRIGVFGSAQGADGAWGGVQMVGFGSSWEQAFGDAVHATGWGLHLSAMFETGREGTTAFDAVTSRVGATYHF